MGGRQSKIIPIDIDDNINCKSCFGCVNCEDCIKCFNCYNCIYCINCAYCDNCDNCNNCYGCKGLISKSNVFLYDNVYYHFKKDKITGKYPNVSKLFSSDIERIVKNRECALLIFYDD